MKILSKILFLIVLIFTQIDLKAQRILFVGNSLSYSNNLPKIVEDIATKFNISINADCLCYPNYAIVDHLNDVQLNQILSTNKIDFLIVQQGPSSQPEGKKMLIEDGAKLKVLCEKNNIKMGYFMVWTSKKWYHTFDLVIKNHELAAQKNNVLLFPVGNIWKLYNEENESENLYDFDGFHPSKAGSFLSALTIFHKLYPNKNLRLLKFNDYKNYLENEESYKKMVDLIYNN